MATIPTVPTFATGDSSLDNLIALSSAVTFLADCGTRPVFHLFHQSSTVSLASGTSTTVPCASVAYDNDGVSDGTGATIVTQGWYHLSGCVNAFQNTATSALGYIKIIAGASNPHYSSGTSVVQCVQGGETVTLTGGETDFSFGGMSTVCLYPGDQVRLLVSTVAAATAEYNTNTSYMLGRFPPTLTGYWVRTGT